MAKKLKFYVIATETGEVAQCIKTQMPLIGPYTPEYKDKMLNLLWLLQQETPKLYDKCRLIKVKQTKI
jgi:hypothetical protein